MKTIKINVANGKKKWDELVFVPYGRPVLDEEEAKKQALTLYLWMCANLPAMTLDALSEVLANESEEEAK